MTESAVYNVVGLLIVAAALAEAWYFWAHPELVLKFKNDLRDALDHLRGPPGPPDSPA
jgi:hypothetical protein